jgi:hypothetical protein
MKFILPNTPLVVELRHVSNPCRSYSYTNANKHPWIGRIKNVGLSFFLRKNPRTKAGSVVFP